MPAYCRGANSLGTKLVTLYPDNEKKGLPTHLGIVLLFDATTGILQAVSGHPTLHFIVLITMEQLEILE